MDVLDLHKLSAQRFALVGVDVKRFLKSYANGAREPIRFFDTVAPEHKERVARWLTTPQEQRIFVAGSGRNAKQVRVFAERARDRGYETFFYDFCRDASQELCSSELVGAFFRTAGHALVLDSPEARASRFVPHEVQASQQLLGGEALATLIAPSEIAAAAGGTVLVGIVAFELAADGQQHSGATIVPAVSTQP